MEMNTELLQLISQLEAIKLEETQLKIDRLSIEEQITFAVANSKEEGSKSVSNDDVTVTVTNGVTRTIDFDALQILSDELPTAVSLVTMKPSLNLKALKIAEAMVGEQFQVRLNQAITIKPKKVSVSFKRKL